MRRNYKGTNNPKFRHGETGSQLWRAWVEMRLRCKNKNRNDFKNYGGRGIRVCKRWDNYLAFSADMGPHPGKGWTLDRKNVNGNYYKRNCRWTTRTDQARNQRRTKFSALLCTQIRYRYAAGETQVALAKEFRTWQGYISNIVHRRVWK